MVKEETLPGVLLFAAVVKPHPETYNMRTSASRSTPSGLFFASATVQCLDDILRTLCIILDLKALFPIVDTPFVPET